MASVLVQKTIDGICEITLNRPDIRNAFDPEMISELTRIFTEINADKTLRLVLLQGAGKVFCAGADLAWMQSMVNFNFQENKDDSLALFEMFEAILNCVHPVVGLVHGAAFGGALGLIAACDVVLATSDAKYCFSEVKLGIAPAVISSFILRKASAAQVNPYMISGMVFDSLRAQQMGLVTEIQDSMIALRERWVNAFLEAAPGGVRDTKNLVKEIHQQSWMDQKNNTTDLIAKRRISAEGQEGLKSFLNKSNPSWKLK